MNADISREFFIDSLVCWERVLSGSDVPRRHVDTKRRRGCGKNQIRSDNGLGGAKKIASTLLEWPDAWSEWKTGLSVRPTSGMTTRSLQKEEMMPYPALWGYELEIPSAAVPLTDHLVVSVYGPDSSLIARFSAAP